MILNTRFFGIMLSAVVLLAASCKKDYYTDTGKHTPNYDGNALQYLKSKPQYFDSISKIIKLAGMESVFSQEDITFFAPADSSVNLTLKYINDRLRSLGRKEVFRMEQIKPEVWRNQLSRYLFKGKKSLNDFPQLDPNNVSAYPGQIYGSYDGALMNVGVIYNDAGGVRYAGYRQLQLSFIPSASAPRDVRSWYSATVASSNIAPTNGYVHALRYSSHFFGFEPNQFLENALDKGID
ncbi:MAG: hypothetical protein V4722_25670 [Bacteroidota bacterium]